MPRHSTPLTEEKLSVKRSINPFLGENSISAKDIPKLEEWPTFSGEGEYNHIELIRTINVLQEDSNIPDEIIVAKFNLDTGEFCTCIGKDYLQIILPELKNHLLPIEDVQFSSASNNMYPLGILDTNIEFPHPSGSKEEFVTDQLAEAQINPSFSPKVRKELINVLYTYKNAFASDDEPLYAIKWHEVYITLNVGRQHPPVLKGPAYPARPRAREAFEKHIQELIQLGVLRKVGHDE
ncbi:hypothetical protein O181_065343 [Austropuccinia psidii MF-1]|uniref:Uncharacterized protein n=1 Tax=Austropuccinia psidii MF-1 TaxID=1389203 RepID=A0A9Q3EV70_9BASI|nr:hypothetical protein [Austropuccinia psidii MF-1]